MTEKENTIEKIKKLLRMKKGGTLAEVETALLLAQKIANKHGIDIGSINPDEITREPITQASNKTLSRLQMESRFVAILIDRFFNVKTFVLCNGSYSVVFVGTQTDIEIAMYIYTFLVRCFRNEWNNNRGRLRNRKAFMQGLFEGLYVKLNSELPLVNDPAAVVFVSHQIALKNYMDENYPNLTKTKLSDNKQSTARYKGYMLGKKIQIRKGIKTDKERLQID